MTTVYTCFYADVIHEGRRNIIKMAKQCGDEVVVGILSDKAMLRFNRFPIPGNSRRVHGDGAGYRWRFLGDFR